MTLELVRSLCLACILLLLLWGSWQAPLLPAQTPVADRLRTELQFEILFPRERPNGVVAQEWSEIFAKLNVPLRIRQPGFNDQMGVDQLVYGTIRRVKVTGQLDRSGMIVFPDREFKTSEVAKLAEWIEELKVYGAQGAPEGQPLWGLKQAEFDRLHAEMKQPVTQETVGLSLTDAIRALQLPENYPLRFSVETRQQLVDQKELPFVSHDLREFAKGTALALLLRGYGLAFSPRRLPDESIVLAIDPYEPEVHTWPIGWDSDSLGLKRLDLAEKLFAAQSISIEQTPLTDLLPRIENETEIPVYIDPLALQELNLKPDRLMINFPRKQTSWSLCLKTISARMKLMVDLRVDENDRPFLWLTKYALPASSNR